MKKKVRNKFLILICIFVLLLGISNLITYKVMAMKRDTVGDKLDDIGKKFEYASSELKSIENAKAKEAKQIIDNASFRIDDERAKNIKKVMIVAHPDDETLWGGNHISKGDYLVICLTNGDNKIRSKEFASVMQLTGNYGIMLKYPDAPNHIKNTWAKSIGSIRNDVDYILNYKKWDVIATHNPNGEYGHMQHKMTSMAVTNECSKYRLTNKLQYFEKYYKPAALVEKNIEPTLTYEQVQRKDLIMIKNYPSQAYSYKVFKHMLPYEKYIKYNNWTY